MKSIFKKISYTVFIWNFHLKNLQVYKEQIYLKILFEECIFLGLDCCISSAFNSKAKLDFHYFDFLVMQIVKFCEFYSKCLKVITRIVIIFRLRYMVFTFLI